MLEDTAEFKLHRRIVRVLEGGVKNREWWIWIDFQATEETDVSLVGLHTAVERWLEQVTPDGQLKRPERVREFTWTGGGIQVGLIALPRGPATRGSPELVGNPIPAFAFWTGSQTDTLWGGR